jgi:hypothetical protein
LTALKERFVYALTLFFILSLVLPFSACGVSGQEVTATISDAEQTIGFGFKAVLDAEQAGANVSSLLVKLNEGAELLSRARMAFEDGNLDEAARLSGLSSEVGSQVESEAKALEVEAGNAAVNRFWLYLGSSALAMVVVVLVTFLGYRFLKRRYFEHLLEMKPKVEEA